MINVQNAVALILMVKMGFGGVIGAIMNGDISKREKNLNRIIKIKGDNQLRKKMGKTC